MATHTHSERERETERDKEREREFCNYDKYYSYIYTHHYDLHSRFLYNLILILYEAKKRSINLLPITNARKKFQVGE